MGQRVGAYHGGKANHSVEARTTANDGERGPGSQTTFQTLNAKDPIDWQRLDHGDDPPGSGLGPTHFFADHGIMVKRVLTDNGNCYGSMAFADASYHHRCRLLSGSSSPLIRTGEDPLTRWA
jgi:hypothetical protein